MADLAIGEEDEHERIMVEVDEKRFQQVLLNYQSNGLKFIEKEIGKLMIIL